ncbi:class I SAM-dependent methyltransferase [Haloplanus salinarum]|jgi:ubiquinone/menaquinone biosynthesis C-methylase UbiE|uniref:class I SAM-dependent methyltransferase n=1 Tax=Haloplanus salinarum TaxID=1912324 RepID=UPI00214AAA7B|nr:class I SAM-dependent methyltransferase [Haloplanus salinarum]
MSNVESFVRFCESEFGSAVMDCEAAYIKQHVAPDDRILNVGCGIGSLEERFTDYDIVGIDISEAMVRTARQRTSTPFLVDDARTLPVRTDAVDAVVFVATLEFISEIEAVLKEATRVLRSGGRIVALILNTRSEYVQSNLRRDGSYFQQMVHRDSEALADRVLNTVDGTQEYFLGIADETVVESSDPTTAAVTAVVGTPIGDSK